MTLETKQQFTFRITQANPTEMIVILYEMTLQYLSDASQAAEEDGFAGYQAAVLRARGCVVELLQSLHMEYELAAVLRQLYLFCLRRLSQAEVRMHPELLQEVVGVIMPLCDAYRKIASQNTADPVMQNAQAVYAGLTYGKNSLVENMADQSVNRGMLI